MIVVVAAALLLILMALAILQIVVGAGALVRHEDGRQIFMAMIVAFGGLATFVQTAESFARLMLA